MAHNLQSVNGVQPVQEGMYLRGAKGNNDKMNQKEILAELEKKIRNVAT